MKPDNKKEEKAEVGVDNNLKKYLGKNLSPNKSAAFKENIKQIKSAIDKKANLTVR